MFRHEISLEHQHDFPLVQYLINKRRNQFFRNQNLYSIFSSSKKRKQTLSIMKIMNSFYPSFFDRIFRFECLTFEWISFRTFNCLPWAQHDNCHDHESRTILNSHSSRIMQREKGASACSFFCYQKKTIMIWCTNLCRSIELELNLFSVVLVRLVLI